jgi:nucleotide-binding universal stress UspA family protein
VEFEGSLATSGNRFSRVLVAVDASESAIKAVGVGIEIAKAFRSELTILHIIEIPVAPISVAPYLSETPAEIDPSKLEDSKKTEGERMVSRAASVAKENGLEAAEKIVTWTGAASEGICDYADKNGMDLVVVGSKEQGGLKKLLLGSVASGVINHAKCSVIVAR